jgi:hypothetical protein
MSSWDRFPGPRISDPPTVQGELPDDEDASGLRRFVHRRSATLLLIAIVVIVLAIYLVVSLTMTRPGA